MATHVALTPSPRLDKCVRVQGALVSPFLNPLRSMTVVQGGDTNSGVERALIEEVHDAVSDLVDLIKTYQNKNKLSKVLMSTLFKRRQEELDAVVDKAILHLHVSDVSCAHGWRVKYTGGSREPPRGRITFDSRNEKLLCRGSIMAAQLQRMIGA